MSTNQDPKARGLIYAARMRYLKSRDRRRKSGLQLDTNDSDNLYLSTPENCDPKILTPPPEVETRSHAFKQAYWRYHVKPVRTNMFGRSPDEAIRNMKLKDLLPCVKIHSSSLVFDKSNGMSSMLRNPRASYS
jgi:hypothetical protein